MLSIINHSPHEVQPGYWLFAPFYEDDTPNLGLVANPDFLPGPYIFDDRGVDYGLVVVDVIY